MLSLPVGGDLLLVCERRGSQGGLRFWRWRVGSRSSGWWHLIFRWDELKSLMHHHLKSWNPNPGFLPDRHCTIHEKLQPGLGFSRRNLLMNGRKLVSRFDSGLLFGLRVLIGKTLSYYYCAVVFPTMQNRKATLRGYNQPHPSVFEQPQKWQGSEHLKNRIQALWPSFCLSNWHTEGAQYLLAGCLEKWFAQSSFC